MLFKVGDKIIDTNITPVGLVFVDADEANRVAKIISSIQNGNTQYSIDGNGRWWFMTPGEWTMEEKDKWSLLTDEQKELLQTNVVISGKLDFQL